MLQQLLLELELILIISLLFLIPDFPLPWPALYLLAQSPKSCLTLPPEGLQPSRLLYPWDFWGKNPGVSCYFLFQGIILTQGLNPHLLSLLCWQMDSLPLNHLGSIVLTQWNYADNHSQGVYTLSCLARIDGIAHSHLSLAIKIPIDNPVISLGIRYNFSRPSTL